MNLFIFLLSLLSLTTAFPLFPRHSVSIGPRQSPSLAPQLLPQIAQLNADVPKLTEAVNAFPGSPLETLPRALGVAKAELTVDKDILLATGTTKLSGAFTAEESTAIVNALASGIGPIQDSLNALKAKYPEFKKLLATTIILLDLKRLKSHTDDFIAALQEKATGPDAGLLGFGKVILDQAFDEAIAVYSN